MPQLRSNVNLEIIHFTALLWATDWAIGFAVMQPPRTVLITAGPGWAPIDGVRRITNLSTGRLGSVLARHFAECGWQAHLLRGELSTEPPPTAPGIQIVAFSTLEDFGEKLELVARAGGKIDAVLHAAALPDFLVEGADRARKLESRKGETMLRLIPAPKMIDLLRALFPESLLVGWKYEVEGDRFAALARGREQIARAKTDVCVVNGPAYATERSWGIANAHRWLAHDLDASALAVWLEGHARAVLPTVPAKY